MVSFVMVVRHVLTDRASQVALAERDQPTQAFELDGPSVDTQNRQLIDTSKPAIN